MYYINIYILNSLTGFNVDAVQGDMQKKRCIQFQTIYSTLETYRKLNLYAKQSDFVIKKKKKKTNTVWSKSAEIHRQTLFNNNNRPYATNKSIDSECAANKANYDAFCSDSMDSKLIYLLNVALVWLEKIETLNIDWTLIAFRMNLSEKRKKMQTKRKRMKRISMIKHLVKQDFGCERPVHVKKKKSTAQEFHTEF